MQKYDRLGPKENWQFMAMLLAWGGIFESLVGTRAGLALMRDISATVGSGHVVALIQG